MKPKYFLRPGSLRLVPCTLSLVTHSLLLVSCAFCLFMTSCKKDLLDPLPQTNLLDTLSFSTSSRVQQEVNGMYASVKSGQFLGGRYLVYMDVRGEDFINRTANGVTAFQTWNFTITPTTNEVQNLWSGIYAAINRCNVVLAGIDHAAGRNIITAAVANQYRGEARFLRGLCYYALLTIYARPYWDANGDKPGVPLRLKAETQIDPASNIINRSKVAAVYTQVLADLDFAETNLPLTNATATATTNSALNVTHAHRNSAIALKTRVYLTMRQYDKVIAEANKIVPLAAPFQAATGVGHRLEPAVTSVFASPYVTLEHIFSMPFTSLDLPGTQNGLGSYYNPGPNGAGDYNLNPTGIMAHAGWKATDARRTFNQVSGGLTYLRKWFNNSGSNPDWAPVIRYAEVLLTLAEALVRNGNAVDARAVDLLNAVRQRSDNTTSWTTASFATPEALLDQLALERRIELLGEGLRSIDIMRLGQTFPAKAGSVSAPAVAPDATQYIWPIPLNERLVNTTIEQNNGY